MDSTLRGVKPGSRTGRPRTATAGRVCRHEACATVISIYNTTDHCNAHRPRRYPRVRGVVTKA
jgi:hypothetical protein